MKTAEEIVEKRIMVLRLSGNPIDWEIATLIEQQQAQLVGAREAVNAVIDEYCGVFIKADIDKALSSLPTTTAKEKQLVGLLRELLDTAKASPDYTVRFTDTQLTRIEEEVNRKGRE